MAISSIGNSGPPPSATPQAGGAAPVPVRTEALPTPAPAPTPPPSREAVEKAIESVKKVIEPAVANNLEFAVDKETGKTVVSVTDAETGEMIRQIPSKELIEIAKSLDKLQGLLLRQEA